MKELKQQKEKKKAPKQSGKEAKTSEPKKKEASPGKENSSKIISCDCTHEAQDQMYGKGRRLCRRLGGAKAKCAGYKCTVCDKIHNY